MPVLPAVASTTSPPGRISARFSASRMICRAGRSFTDCPGFMNSALPRIVQPVAAEARLSLISGVLPMAATMSSLTRMGCDLGPGLVRHVGEGPRRRSLADDGQPSLFVFGAVPMHLLAEMGHEAACRHRYRVC